MGSALIRVGTLSGARHPLVAARHNKRELPDPAGSIDTCRSHLNLNLRGPNTAIDVAATADALVRTSGQRFKRKDAVRAHEVILSLPQDFVGDIRTYFEHGVAWLEAYFAVPVLSADVHLDESARHCHVLLLPLRNGRLLGARMMPGPSTFQQFLRDFENAVAIPHGLKPVLAKLTGKAKRDAVGLVLKKLSAIKDPVLGSALWPVLRDHIERNPSSSLELLGLTTTATPLPAPRRTKTFVDIMTSPGRGPRWEPSTGVAEQPDSGHLC